MMVDWILIMRQGLPWLKLLKSTTPPRLFFLINSAFSFCSYSKGTPSIGTSCQIASWVTNEVYFGITWRLVWYRLISIVHVMYSQVGLEMSDLLTWRLMSPTWDMKSLTLVWASTSCWSTQLIHIYIQGGSFPIQFFFCRYLVFWFEVW